MKIAKGHRHEHVHAPQQVVLRDAILEPELVEQLALIASAAHHHRSLPIQKFDQGTESVFGGLLKAFFDSIDPKRASPTKNYCDRWLFLIGMSIFVGFCTYMMPGTSRWYFWYVAGFSVPLLALAGGLDPLNDFQTVITRSEETALGIVCYTA